ncbi:MAG: hypothetical protein OHK0053_08660 [Microscillaceae bacterium]
MDSTKNFIDAWMNTQNKLVDNLMDTSKKIQESFQKGEVVEKSVELYSQWFDKQKSLADSMLHILKNQWKPEEKKPDFVNFWLDSQMQMAKMWMAMLPATGSQPEPAAFASHMENMQKMYADWSKGYGQLFPSPNGQPWSQMAQAFNPQQLHHFIDNTRTYMKMFELWQPIYKMMQSNTMGLDSLSKMMDIEKYKEVLDGIFHFMDGNKSAGFLEMIQKYNDFAMQMLKNNGSANVFESLQSFMPAQMMDKNFNVLSQISQQFSEQFAKFINPYFTMVPAGREKEMGRIAMDIQDMFMKYFVKATEMQGLVYKAGFMAIEKAVQQVMQKAQENTETSTFDDFYNTWVNTIEEEIIELFGSESYSRLQGELLKLGLDIKAQTDKLLEMLLAPLPLVPRSEMDEMNAALYELKTKVRQLEKRLKATEKTDEIAPAQQ